MIFTIRATVGRENAVMETLASKTKNMQLPIKSIFHPDELKGYLFVEGELQAIEKASGGVPHIRGIIKKDVPLLEIKKFLETRRIEIKLNRGDVVEVMGGPFKNEKGRVTRVDEAKGEITIELLEAAIPIPITVGLDSVRVIESVEKSQLEQK